MLNVNASIWLLILLRFYNRGQGFYFRSSEDSMHCISMTFDISFLEWLTVTFVPLSITILIGLTLFTNCRYHTAGAQDFTSFQFSCSRFSTTLQNFLNSKSNQQTFRSIWQRRKFSIMSIPLMIMMNMNKLITSPSCQQISECIISMLIFI